MNTNSKIEQIKDVAIFLRKSRGEDEDLEKHRQELEELCKSNGWRYTTYEELGTSTDLEYRPETQKLLKDISEDFFDGVLVMDKDRLSRESTGQALINKTLIDNDCLIITPHRIYDLSNESDILMSEVEDLMARFEYRMITKRFRRGKKRGAKMGNWVNGTPPFPYVYNPEIKGLEVDEDKNKWYQFMKEKFFEGWTFKRISVELNTMGVRTNKGNLWHENSVRRLLLSEVHLGQIAYNKTEGSGHLKKKSKPLVERPKDEWIIAENCHTAVKTKEEHSKIKAILASRRKVPRSSEQIKLPLTGLVKCGICGRTMGVFRRESVTKGTLFEIRKCTQRGFFGEKCTNRGGNAQVVLDYILIRLESKKSAIDKELENMGNENSSSEAHYRLKQDAAIEKLKKKEDAVDRAYLAYEDGMITLEKYKQRTEQARKEIQKIKDEIQSYDVLIKESNSIDKNEQLEQLKELSNLIQGMKDTSDTELNIKVNELLKLHIYDIVWTRIGDNVNMEVNFK